MSLTISTDTNAMEFWNKILDSIDKNTEGSPPSASSSRKALKKLKPINEHLNVSGRVPLNYLKGLVDNLSEQDFITYVGTPVLLGSSIIEGLISEKSLDPSARKKTRLFIPAHLVEEVEVQSDSLQRAIYPLITANPKALSKTELNMTLGRSTSCDIVMQDFAISEHHANIIIHAGHYSLQDNTSTNGTTVDGKKLGNDPVNLEDGQIIQFARYEFKVLFPVSLFNLLLHSAR